MKNKLVMRRKEENNGFIVLARSKENEIEKMTNAIVDRALYKKAGVLDFEKERALKLMFNACNHR